MILNFLDFIGAYFISSCNQLGKFTLFSIRIFLRLLTTKLKVKQVIIQMKHIGVESFTIVFLTGVSSGFALALQSYMGLSWFGGEGLLGIVVAIGLSREIAPVFTGLMVTGRAGSAMAAEIATMQITEQIEALKTLSIDPYQYIIIPRIIASTIMLPFLTTISILCGAIGGYIYSVKILGLNSEVYLSTIRSYLFMSDIIGGLIKSSFFGLILSLVGTYMGYNTSGGAQSVGVSTTKSVVIGSILILIANYFLSTILFKAGIQ